MQYSDDITQFLKFTLDILYIIYIYEWYKSINNRIKTNNLIIHRTWGINQITDFYISSFFPP